MSLAGKASETLAILQRGAYTAPSGATVSIRTLVDAAVAGTVLYRPGDFDGLGASLHPGASPLHIEVTAESTGAAARRLAENEGVEHLLALNFASAKNPGGGFLGGARAQEEDLARCSALYRCQLTQREYYDANRNTTSMLYTEHLIYSPDVPFFRDERGDLLEKPFVTSLITSPAPNAGEALRRDAGAGDAIRSTLTKRAGHVLTVAAAHGHRVIVLGAWGCGVFRNEPAEVAGVFAHWLNEPQFAHAFERVVFAIYDRAKKQETLRAFQRQFGFPR